MKLYTVQVAPNPTKVELYLAEKRLVGGECAIKRIEIKLMSGEQRQSQHRARNPFASLPVLEIGEQEYLVESLPIIEYFEETLAGDSLWGETPQARAHARDLERIADCRILVNIARYVHATRSPIGLPKSRDIAQSAERSLITPLEFFDSLLADGRDFIGGKRATVADCTLAAAFQFARFGQFQIDPNLAALHRWDREYRERAPAKSVLRC